MKIIRLAAENYMRLEAVEIVPQGNMIVVSGENGAGKSAVLSAIVSALAGGKSIPDKPIKDGESTARIEVETEEFIVTRRFTQAGTRLEITTQEGYKAPSPQAMLDKIIGDISFDPLEFSRMDAKKQRSMLMGLLGLDFSDLDEKFADLKQLRSDAGKEKNRLTVELESIRKTPGLPAEPISVSSLMEQLKSVEQKEREAMANKSKADALISEQQRLIQQIKGLESRVKQIDSELQQIGPIETSPEEANTLRKQIGDAESTNALIRANILHKSKSSELNQASEWFSKLLQQMNAVEEEKAKRLASVKMPVEGLGISPDGVVFDGIPLSQVNSAKQIEICVAISMAMNPKLRVLRMNGNDLDSKTLATISKMVKDNDYQAWVERIEPGSEIGIIIEDGHVKEQK